MALPMLGSIIASTIDMQVCNKLRCKLTLINRKQPMPVSGSPVIRLSLAGITFLTTPTISSNV